MNKHWTEEASIGDFIISHLLSCASSKIQKKILYELVQEKRRMNRQIFYNNLRRLKQRGILNFDQNQNIIFSRKNLQSRIIFNRIIKKPVGNTKVMVLFDIPEKKRKIRNWLRLHLKLWDFEMLQQSVWLGKGPLPKEFIARLNQLGIGKCVRVFRIENIKSEN